MDTDTAPSNYHHLMADFDLRPLKIRAHLVEAHRLEPKVPRKRYEREVWHGQHDADHRAGATHAGVEP